MEHSTVSSQQAGQKQLSATILIAEDDAASRNLLETHMKRLGYASLPAATGEETIALACTAVPNLILLDLIMPGISGVEACRILRSLDKTRHIPIIAITGIDDQALKMECLSAGANDFITKPIDGTELMIKVHNLLQIREYEEIKNRNRSLSETILTIERAKREWEQTMDCITDLVILVDGDGAILRCNRPLTTIVGADFGRIIRQPWREVLAAGGFAEKATPIGTVLYAHVSGQWFEKKEHPIATVSAAADPTAVITLHDVTLSRVMTEELRKNHDILAAKNRELADAYRNLQSAQSQVLQQEKMASIGQLAAGVAHEINNPMGFIISNLNSLGKYIDKLVEFQEFQDELLSSMVRATNDQHLAPLEERKRSLKIDFIRADARNLIRESLEGADRVKMIVQDLKSFSRIDEAEQKTADINAGLESTINIAWNEIKYKASLVKDFGDLPMIKCNPGQLNQVFMNLLVNAAHAIERQGEIRVKTWLDGNAVHVSISDTGSGIRPEDLGRIFEPFFTTKEVGSGTGLGLSIAYDIVHKHGGEIRVESIVGTGTTFTVVIPIVV